ncbi:murein hydrolase transporter LrgA [Salipiger aestuarii]|uniref:Holin-like protein n=1 Tax=Salipiger aestuarii TaxID=568098 RepID=A0A327YAN6_9RHOB|nr:CidA/LrgA family protein [Salipiger aestuarii]EIE51926.1 hypothetical protein C357_06609 [Citreicella sp. 357]KAA8608357.1 murein hydrolase transporter LrgA [Salipiger aestuarii]KAA8612915.1 murein hydrolase transporter LrgA [Salipiger aestuarii]KAB2542175.1 murein hydrolase transporter LrgA [Salipiger aestuarii]RAK16855.1 holin-like protein [Salipiger aestuarii]
MLSYVTLIFSCQFVGEFLVGALGVPVPGPVIGLVLLLLFLLIKGAVPEDLARVGAGLLGSMSLLFVPAGAGIMLHFHLLAEAALPLGAGVVVSTAATIAVTGVLMAKLGAEAGDE